MLLLPLLLLLLLPDGRRVMVAEAGALPLAFFRHLQRLPYFGHGSGGHWESGAGTKLLNDHAGQQTTPAQQQGQHRGPGASAAAGIRPLGANEEQEQERGQHQQEHHHQQQQQQQQQQRPAADPPKAKGGATIIVPPPTAAASGKEAPASAHPHVHHWGLSGDGYHAVMAGRCWLR